MPVGQRDARCRRFQTFPPNATVTRLTHICEYRVLRNGFHGIRVCLQRGTRGHTEEPVFWVNGSEFTWKITSREPSFTNTSKNDCRIVTEARIGAQTFCLSPWLSNFIQAISSPTHSTFQPGSVGFIMARLVFPQALGKAAAMYRFTPWGFVIPRI